MIRNFKFDYDEQNDDLFIYDPTIKSLQSIEMGDLIIDFSNKKKVSALELMHALSFFKDLIAAPVSKHMLKDIKECKVDVIEKGGFLMIKLFLIFKSRKQIMAPLVVPAMPKQAAVAEA